MLPVDHTYVINLERRKEKWFRTSAELNRYGIKAHRFNAIDGSASDFKAENHTKAHIFSTPGQLACLMTHIKVIEDAKANRYSRIAIFEDDIYLSKTFGQDIEKLKNISYRILYLGATQLNWDGIDVCNDSYKARNTLGTWAMLIDSRAYDGILESYRRLDACADAALVRIQSQISSIVMYPNLCITDVQDSDVNPNQYAPTFNESCRWDLNRYRVRGGIKLPNIIVKGDSRIIEILNALGWNSDGPWARKSEDLHGEMLRYASEEPILLTNEDDDWPWQTLKIDDRKISHAISILKAWP